MLDEIRKEYGNAVTKRDEIRSELETLEAERQKSHYDITVTRDRLAYWEGKVEGLKFAIDCIERAGQG
jgi:chromosome segregation ATPase